MSTSSMVGNISSDELAAIQALSPLDGRYQRSAKKLAPIFSEAGLIRRRVQVEIEWLMALSNELHIVELPPFKTAQEQIIRNISERFDDEDAIAVKRIERTTNHDVKAVEYWIKQQLQDHSSLVSALEFVHFAMTSEDVNNLAYALMLKDARAQILLPTLDQIEQRLVQMVQSTAALPMLSRTHGQTASPTTLGKELANVVARLRRQITQLEQVELLGKCAGAVGNYNAHQVSYPEVDWLKLSQAFVESLGLKHNPMTTQIEPHDFIAELCDVCSRICTILIDFARDVWGYISLGYFKLLRVEGEVGSSTMPHKVNPIDFENAEGNFGIARALFQHFSEKLPISRWQRDLTDSTVLRSLGSAFGYLQIALDAVTRGLSKLSPNQEALNKDLDEAQEVLAEAIQTVMRRYGLPEPYERLKQLTRGERMTAERIRSFVSELALPEDVKLRLLELQPGGYFGYAEKLAKSVI